MTASFSLRPFGPRDGPAFGQLLLASPDTGRIHTTRHYRVNPYAVLSVLQEDFSGVVAEMPGHEGLVGAGLIRFGRAQIEGALRPYALLNTLIVHPEFRKRGIASALVRWRVQAARERFGSDVVIWALIQQGNIGSVRTVTKHLKQIIADRIRVIPMKMRHKPPKPVSGWRVRSAEREDLAEIAGHLNSFHREHNFYEPQTADTLARWLTASPLETPFRHYLILTDATGEMLAGAGVAEMYRLSKLHVVDMSPALRLLNMFLRMVPADGVSTELTIARLWHAPGQMRAAKHLLEHIRWQWRDGAAMALASVDRENPLVQAFPLRPWTPSTRSSLVATGPVRLSPRRLIAYE